VVHHAIVKLAARLPPLLCADALHLPAVLRSLPYHTKLLTSVFDPILFSLINFPHFPSYSFLKVVPYL